MQIGALARQIGVSADAIRFYERNSLLRKAPRTAGGFRQYAESDLETLSLIRRLQRLGFKLKEIRGFLHLRCDRSQPCASARRRLAGKLAEIEAKMEELRHVETELRAALRSCDRALRERTPRCPVLRGAGERKVRGAR